MKKILSISLLAFSLFMLPLFHVHSDSTKNNISEDTYLSSFKNGGTILNKKIFRNKDFEDLDSLVAYATIVPNLINGNPVGTKINSVSEKSILKKVGLEPGDILLAVNKSKVDIEHQALSFLGPLLDPAVKKVIFKIIRNEKLINLEIRKR